jgi:hypothetical protein
VGGDLYFAGYQANPLGIWVATYWKNGTPVSVSDGIYDAEIFGVVRVGPDLYTAGYEGNASGGISAKMWKNGTPTLLAPVGEASAIVVVVE